MICALCHRRQIVVWYDGADRAVGRCCVRAAFRFADAEEVEEAIAAVFDVEQLERRLNGTPIE